METAGKKKHGPNHHWGMHQAGNNISRVFGQFELNRLICFALHNGCQFANSVVSNQIADFELYETATTQFAINGDVK